jgi:hypothetical protein
VKSDGGLEASLQSFPTLAIGRSEREFPHHIRPPSGKELSVSSEQEIGWKAELVWMLKGKKRFIQNFDVSGFVHLCILVQYGDQQM